MASISRRELLKLAAGALAATALPHSACGQAQAPRFRDADRTRDKIVALVRSFGDEDPKLLRLIQMIEPVRNLQVHGVKARPEDLPLWDYFVGELYLNYSFDDPKFVSSVSAGDLKRLKLKREELLPLSVANFRRLYPNLRLDRPQPNVVVVGNGGELEPSLMLDARVWEAEAQRAKSGIVVAVPARDTLMYSDRSSPRNVDSLKQLATDVYEVAGGNALSRRIFLWNYGRWEVFA